MRILKTITTLSVLLLTTGVIAGAISPVSVNEPQLVNENTAQQVLKTGGPGGALYMDKFDILGKKYTENFRNCVPLHYDQYMDIFGLKIKLKFDINGWIDSKCEVKAFVNVLGLGKDIREVFEIKASDEQLAAIKAAVECHLTKEQLNIAIDAFVARNAKNEAALSAMMESPEKAISKKREMTPEETRLAQMLFTENACTIPNKEVLKQQINDLMGIGTK